MTSSGSNIEVDPIALIAVFISAASLVVSIVAIRSDNAKLHFTVRRGWKLLNAQTGYKTNTPYLSISVSNRGKRSIVVSTVGGQNLKDNSGFMLADSYRSGPREIKPAKSTTYLIEMSLVQAHEKDKGIAYLYFTDGTNKTYRYSMTPIYKRFFYWFVRKYKRTRASNIEN